MVLVTRKMLKLAWILVINTEIIAKPMQLKERIQRGKVRQRKKQEVEL
jgi:hypothetical protein